MRTRRTVAERMWKERKARERGRVAVPGLDAVMERTGVTGVDLAWQVGKDERTVRGYRKGWNRPDSDTRIVMAEVLGVTVEELEGRKGVADVGGRKSA